jgi:hypothetical protein
MAAWRNRFLDRTIAHVSAGPGWGIFALSGKPAPNLFFIARPGAALLWDATEKLDPDITKAMGSQRRSSLAGGRCSGFANSSGPGAISSF